MLNFIINQKLKMIPLVDIADDKIHMIAESIGKPDGNLILFLNFQIKLDCYCQCIWVIL